MLEPMWFHCVGAGLQVDSVFIEVDQTVWALRSDVRKIRLAPDFRNLTTVYVGSGGCLYTRRRNFRG
jgi:hypothetical protein